MELTNSQCVLIAELKLLIDKMKSEGAKYEDIKAKCIEYGRSHWFLITGKDQNIAIGLALYQYAMDDKQRIELDNFLNAVTGELEEMKVIDKSEMSEVEEHHRKRHELGDALVKHCKPINYHYGTPPICQYSERILLYQTWECKHPERKDTHEYTEPCTELDFMICPLNNERKLWR